MKLNPPSAWQLWIGSGLLLWLLYATVFMVTTGSISALQLAYAGANALPLILISAATHQTLKGQVLAKSVLQQATTHVLLAPLFSLAWYSIALVLLGFVNGVRGGSYAPDGFSGPAASWQLVQGLILYGLVAAVCYAIRGGRETAEVTILNEPTVPITRYLVRGAEGLRPIEINSVVAIIGAQDYSEVITSHGRHLVRMSLGDFEHVLDQRQFIRVHRSAIINLAYLGLAESAGGGRMIAHMANDLEIPVSRAGAATLRDLVV